MLPGATRCGGRGAQADPRPSPGPQGPASPDPAGPPAGGRKAARAGRDAARTRQAPVRGHRPRRGAAWGQDGHAGRHPGRCPSAGTARRLRPPMAQRGPAGVRAHGLCRHCLRPGEPCRSASTAGGFRARLPRLLPAQDGVIPQRGLWGTNDGAHSHAVEGPGHPPPANRNGRTIWLGRPRSRCTEGLRESRRTPRVVAMRCQPLSLRPSAENAPALPAGGCRRPGVRRPRGAKRRGSVSGVKEIGTLLAGTLS